MGELSRLNVRKNARMRQFVDSHDWISCYFMLASASDLNPVEGIWWLLRCNSQANTAFTDPDHLTRTLRRGLAHIQRHPDLLDGCSAKPDCPSHQATRRQSEKVSSLRA
ncbi:hypothetical protein [Streptomyces sp. MAI_2237]